jgi:hypothetical protein
MRSRLLGLLIAATAILAVLFVYLLTLTREHDLDRVERNAENVEANTEAIFEQLGLLGCDWIRVDGADGNVSIHIRNPGEGDAEFVARVELERSTGERRGMLCETLHCTSGTVQICVACMVGESQTACRARLVAAWCQTHTCDECP